MKILYIGSTTTYRLYKEGKNPSHWLYGVAEMEKEGHQIVWTDETSAVLNDLKLVWMNRPNIVFIPNLNIRNHVLLLCLSSLRLYRKPIIAYLHHEPKVKKGVTSWIYRFLLHGCSQIRFLSKRTLENTVSNGMADESHCDFSEWVPDMSFYKRQKTSDGGYFISTGKENRDFDILIEAFKRTAAPLKIIVARSHAGSNYEDLPQKCKNIPNIEVIITENSGEGYPMMLEAMANSKALVCPLCKDKLNYCVGLSTIADAEGLEKPLIITRNPYHSEERLKGFQVVWSVMDWIEAIEQLKHMD